MSAVPPPPPPVVQQQPAGFTKNCPNCGQYINPKAYVCPYCKKKLRTKPGTWIALAVCVLAVGWCTKSVNRASEESAPKGAWNPAVEAQLAAEHEKDFRVKQVAADAANKEADAKEAAFLKTAAGKIWQKHKEWGREACETIAKKQIYVGMTTEQVRAAWGKPYKINSTIYGHSTHEQWVMHEGGSTFVYFEDGVMTSLQQSK